MSKQDQELEVLFPNGKEVTVGSGADATTINITPFKFGQLGRVMKTVQPISDALLNAFKNHQDSGQMATFISLMTDSSDELLNLVVIGTNLPKPYVESLELDDALELVLAVVQVNADFFIRKVLPVIKGNIQNLVPSVGQTQ